MYLESLTYEYMCTILKFYSIEALPRSIVITIIEEVIENLFKKKMLPRLKDLIVSFIKDKDEITNIDQIFSMFNNLFNNLKTEYQHIKYLKTKGYYTTYS